MRSSKNFFSDFDHNDLPRKQLDGLKWTVEHARKGNPFYRRKLEQAGIGPQSIKNLDDITRLPFTTAQDLRDEYPFPLLSVPEEKIVRIHASSGTTGKRKILSYTQKDVDDWKIMMARCFELAGLTVKDRVQIAVGYGLWTAGVGFQMGCEHFGATAVPLGPGNLDFHLQFLEDMQTTCLCSTASMALLLAEQVEKNKLQDKIGLRRLIFGSEPHTPKMRKRIHDLLQLEDSFDISGMTELYGPGAGQECSAHQGIHYWADYYILEIIDPETLLPVKEGDVGEMVVTTLCKEAAPLIRYRTRDLCRVLPGTCSCGLAMPRHDKILGRSDDMIIFRGVNIYPGQIAEVLEQFEEISSEYQIQLTRKQGLDAMTVNVERKPGKSSDLDQNIAKMVEDELRRKTMVRSQVKILTPGELPRTFSKTKRVLDQRHGED